MKVSNVEREIAIALYKQDSGRKSEWNCTDEYIRRLYVRRARVAIKAYEAAK